MKHHQNKQSQGEFKQHVLRSRVQESAGKCQVVERFGQHGEDHEVPQINSGPAGVYKALCQEKAEDGKCDPANDVTDLNQR